MEATNHEYYVSLEVAKRLKEAEFDWKVNFFYQDGILKSVLPDELFSGDFEDVEYYYRHIGIPHQSLDYNGGTSKFLEEYSAPTLEVAQRWLREVKAMHICVKPNEASANCKYFVTVIINDTKWGNVQDDNRKTIMFDTYEEAQEAGIKKVLEIILEKGE
jgi:hypothetical protein